MRCHRPVEWWWRRRCIVEFVMAITLTPSSGSTAGQTPVAITGTNLLNTSSVRFGLNTATIVGTPTNTLVNVLTPAGYGAVPVTVTAPGGTSLPVTFFYVPLPIKLGVTPSCGSGAGGDSVVITGQNLGGATAVNFGETAVDGPFVPNTAGSLTVTSPAGTGTVPITVTTPAGTVNGLAFTYCEELTPANITVAPDSGPLGGNTMVSIVDTEDGGLTCTSGISFGASPAPFVVISDTELAVVVPPGVAGAVDVVVTTCAGVATVTDGYTYVAPPG